MTDQQNQLHFNTLHTYWTHFHGGIGFLNHTIYVHHQYEIKRNAPD